VAFREVAVIEISEVLRCWLAGAGLRTAAERAGVDRKTARRYVEAAVAAGPMRDGGCRRRRCRPPSMISAVSPGWGRFDATVFVEFIKNLDAQMRRARCTRSSTNLSVHAAPRGIGGAPGPFAVPGKSSVPPRLCHNDLRAQRAETVGDLGDRVLVRPVLPQDGDQVGHDPVEGIVGDA
jgi:hypothetical protein